MRFLLQFQPELPSIEEFKTSTKTGLHSFFEILNARLSVPRNSAKKEVVGPTIPVPLHSEAVWTNGELNVRVKELGMFRALKGSRFEMVLLLLTSCDYNKP